MWTIETMSREVPPQVKHNSLVREDRARTLDTLVPLTRNSLGRLDLTDTGDGLVHTQTNAPR